MSSNSRGRRRLLLAGGTGVTRGLAIGIVAGAIALARPAQADPSDDSATTGVAVAERRAADAFDAYSKGEYTNAVTLYLQAYAAAASAPILYNIARIYDTKLGNRAQAIEYYQRYVGSADARPDLVETTRRRLEQLAAEAAPPLRTDQPASGAGPQAARLANPSAAPMAPSAQPETGWSTERWVGVTLGVAGLVGIGMGSGFGLAARSNADTTHRLCNGNVCSAQAGVDAAQAGKREATISDVGFAAGGALLAAGTILYFLGGERSSDTSAERNVHVEARADGSAWALQLAGRW